MRSYYIPILVSQKRVIRLLDIVVSQIGAKDLDNQSAGANFFSNSNRYVTMLIL
jgi:hypothetical protein